MCLAQTVLKELAKYVFVNKALCRWRPKNDPYFENVRKNMHCVGDLERNEKYH